MKTPKSDSHILKNALYDALRLYGRELDKINDKIDYNNKRIKRGYVDASINLKRCYKDKKFYEKKDKEVRYLLHDLGAKISNVNY